MKALLEETRSGKRWECSNLGGVLAEELDGTETIVVERVVDVGGEVVADGGGRDGNARGPLVDEVLNMGEAVIA